MSRNRKMIGAHPKKNGLLPTRRSTPRNVEREVRAGFDHFTQARHRTHLVRNLNFESP